MSRLTTRSLLVTVVLGAFTAVLVHLSRIVGVALLGAAPWLGSPAPIIPWYLMIVVAALLIPHFGAALITGVIGAAAGVGTQALLSAIMIAIVFAIARAVLHRRGQLPAVGERPWLPWALLSAVAATLPSLAILFTIKEFLLLDAGYWFASLGLRLVTGVLFGYLAYVIVRGLLRAGFEPERPRRAATAAPAVVVEETH